jgi:hypothetical protein
MRGRSSTNPDVLGAGPAASDGRTFSASSPLSLSGAHPIHPDEEHFLCRFMAVNLRNMDIGSIARNEMGLLQGSTAFSSSPG